MSDLRSDDRYLAALGRVMAEACGVLATVQRQRLLCERLGVSAGEAMAVIRFFDLSRQLQDDPMVRIEREGLRPLLLRVVLKLTERAEDDRG